MVGGALGWWNPERHGLWILLAAVAALVLLDFAFDETRFEDIPFFVVLGAVLLGIGLLARSVAKASARRYRAE